MAIGAAFRASSHDDWLRYPFWTSPHAINLREHQAINNRGATHVAKRRQFSAAYKLSVLEEAGRCAGAGAIGALLLDACPALPSAPIPY